MAKKGTKPLILQLYFQQGGLCYYCKQPMNLRKYTIHKRPKGMPRKLWKENTATKEHIYPSGDIRRLISSPVVAVHSDCNSDANKAFTNWYNEGYRYKEYPNILINLLKKQLIH